MCRWSSNPERGSALVEAVAIGSLVFMVVVAAVSATIDLAIIGGSAQEAARSGAVHAARHAGPSAAEDVAGGGSSAERVGDGIRVVVVPEIAVPHPDGVRRIAVTPGAEMPLAPFRSDRG